LKWKPQKISTLIERSKQGGGILAKFAPRQKNQQKSRFSTNPDRVKTFLGLSEGEGSRGDREGERAEKGGATSREIIMDATAVAGGASSLWATKKSRGRTENADAAKRPQVPRVEETSRQLRLQGGTRQV